MTKQITRQQLSAALVERHGQERQQHLYTASVGIAGLGGLGSNIAVQLTRLGIGHLTLADCDRVEISNLNRQSYRLCDIGRPKPEALTEQLLQINPYLCYEPHFLKLTPQNIPEIFAGCNIICEAFDDPEQKAMLTETVLQRLPQAKLIVCSGMAGWQRQCYYYQPQAEPFLPVRRRYCRYCRGRQPAGPARQRLCRPCGDHGHETGAGLHHTLNERRILNYDARR